MYQKWKNSGVEEVSQVYRRSTFQSTSCRPPYSCPTPTPTPPPTQLCSTKLLASILLLVWRESVREGPLTSYKLHIALWMECSWNSGKNVLFKDSLPGTTPNTPGLPSWIKLTLLSWLQVISNDINSKVISFYHLWAVISKLAPSQLLSLLSPTPWLDWKLNSSLVPSNPRKRTKLIKPEAHSARSCGCLTSASPASFICASSLLSLSVATTPSVQMSFVQLKTVKKKKNSGLTSVSEKAVAIHGDGNLPNYLARLSISEVIESTTLCFIQCLVSNLCSVL